MQIARNGNATYTQGGWGEYSGLAMDPDGYNFWLVHQYPVKVKNAGTWRTYVGAFEVAPPIPPSDPMHVGDLDRSSAPSGRKNWTATVVVTFHDGSEAPASGVAVSIQWSGGSSFSGTTDTNGQCAFTRTLSNSVASTTLTVTSADHPTLTYEHTENHDPENDSNGTTITVPKP